eukprot:scaffold76021_cov62-Phaeocystis_antarctica.AAC.1
MALGGGGRVERVDKRRPGRGHCGLATQSPRASRVADGEPHRAADGKEEQSPQEDKAVRGQQAVLQPHAVARELVEVGADPPVAEAGEHRSGGQPAVEQGREQIVEQEERLHPRSEHGEERE